MAQNNLPSNSEFRNLLHALDLVAKQIRTGRVEADYAIRQIDKVSNKLKDLAQEQESAKSAGRFEALYQVSRILGTSLDLQTVLDQVMDAVIQLTGAERGFLMLNNDDGVLTIKAARNYDQETLSDTKKGYSRTVANMVMDSGNAMLTTDAQADPRLKEQQSVMTQSFRSIMAAPLIARGRVIGVAYVENSFVAGLFSPQDLETLEALAGQASVAIDNAILFEETDEKLSKRVDELTMLRRIDLQLVQKLDTQAAMRYTLEMVARISQATQGHLGVIQGDPREIMATHHYSSDNNQTKSTKEHPIHLQNAYPKAWEAVDRGQTIIFDTGQYGLITVMVVPIMLKERAIGVVILLREDGGTFTEDDQELVERIVTRAAINIENGRLFDAVRAANQAKTEFVGIVAHDLKAPMTSIQGYSDLLLMQPDNLDERQVRFLERIGNTVRRMEILVTDLADVTRIESGQFLMEEIRVSPYKVMDALRESLMPQMQERQHTYNETIEDNLPDLFTDYYRLMQVLTNLLTNAIKYTPDSGSITMTLKQLNERIQFSVSDSGIGLSAEQIKQLGTPFWRAEDEFTRSQQGTGLGFFITRSLIEQMGSRIQIESTVGEGSTFTFDVAIAPDDAPSSPMAEA